MTTTLERLSNNYRGILLDAHGVFLGSSTLLPGSKEAMERLIACGKTVGILSNTTQLAAHGKEKLRSLGLFENQHYHFFITSGEIAKTILLEEALPFQTKNKKFYVFGEAHPKYNYHQAIFQETCYQETENLSQADFIYVSVPHINGQDQSDPNVFQERVSSLGKSLPMVCANPDRFAYDGTPPKRVVRQGSVAALYEKSGGEVFYIGKPSQKAFDHAMREFIKYNISAPNEVMMIGDTPETDIRGANHFGMASLLLTQSGIMTDRDVKEISDTPTYFMERFCL